MDAENMESQESWIVEDVRARYAVLRKLAPGETPPVKMETVQVEVWEPNPEKPGYLHKVRTRTIAEVARELNRILEEHGLRPDEYGMGHTNYDHSSDPHGQKREFPPYHWIACFAVTGGSEGHYIHVEVIGAGEDGRKRELIYLGKTFMGWDRAWEIAKACATILGV